jgi:hypothetical protein
MNGTIRPFGHRRFTLAVFDLRRSRARDRADRLIGLVPRSRSHDGTMTCVDMRWCEPAKVVHHRSAITP